MKVKVYPGPFCKTERLDENGFVYLDEGSTLEDLYKIIRFPLPLRGLGLCTVNYEKVKRDIKLKDGDIVSFFTPIAGG